MSGTAERIASNTDRTIEIYKFRSVRKLTLDALVKKQLYFSECSESSDVVTLRGWPSRKVVIRDRVNIDTPLGRLA